MARLARERLHRRPACLKRDRRMHGVNAMDTDPRLTPAKSRALVRLIGLLLFAVAGLIAGLAGPLSPVRAASSTFVVNDNFDDNDNNPGNGICDNGGNVCTLRAAL